MKNTPWSVTVTHALIIITASFWLIFALVSGLGILPGVLSAGPIKWFISALSLGTSAALILLLRYLVRRTKWAYYATLVLIGVIGVLSITDEVGAFDLFTLIISLAAFLLLILNRNWYLGDEKP
jgi:lysylphosphatidylglycerol synthetase-like protein (DUF2156 family)